jgi:Family of unknown function (DUF5681)
MPVDSLQKQEGRDAEGRFRKGQSGNPAGRSRGSHNKSIEAAELLLEGEAEALTRRAVELALEGDAAALRLCLDRSCRRGADGRCASIACRRCAVRPISARRWRPSRPQPRAARSHPARRRSWPGLSRFSCGRSRPAISTGACVNWKSAELRARDTRLDRLIEGAAREDAAKNLDDCSQRAWRRVCAIVREELARSGVEAARVGALSLRKAGDTPELAGADEEYVLPGGDSAAEMFAAKIRDSVRRHEEHRSAPDFANASLAELFALVAGPAGR